MYKFPVRGSRPGKNVQLTENEIRGLCLKSREIFLSQPILLELEAPLKICGMYFHDKCPRPELHTCIWRTDITVGGEKKNFIHWNPVTTLGFGSTLWYKDVSEAALYFTSSRDISLYYHPCFWCRNSCSQTLA